MEKSSNRRLVLTLTIFLVFTVPVFSPNPGPLASEPFSFAVTADMRGFSGPGSRDNELYFQGVCEAIARVGRGAFMISPGDEDPPDDVKWTIEQVLGQDYPWYPVVGNHEAETAGDMDWLRRYNPGGDALPNIVRVGPPGSLETTYSFDYQNAHFVVLNQYYDGYSDVGCDGDMVDALYHWLAEDLAATEKEHLFVFGHEPAYPQPDADSGRRRHFGDSLDRYPARRDRFWSLLRNQGVVAFFCGHTHNYSAVKIDGVWQLDAGHARGAGDRGAPSTFMMVQVDGADVFLTVYRDLHDGEYDYDDIIHRYRAALPVRLSDFRGLKQEGQTALDWVAVCEIPTRGFILQRRQSENGPWTEMARYSTHLGLMGPNGPAHAAEYRFVDRSAIADLAYAYRLAVVSRDGQMEYLGTVEVR